MAAVPTRMGKGLPGMSTVTEDAIKAARILIVDDKPINIALLQAFLEYEGYTDVTCTTDPRDVEALYRQHHFDLVLLDIRMPYMDGHEVLARLAEIRNDDYLPVLVLTAQTDAETKIKALAGGAKDFITKPFERSEVVHRIRNMLEVRMLYNERGRQAEILEQAVRERTQELRETQSAIIRHLARAGEYRDNDTGDHVERMSLLCHRLALAAGLGAERAEVIRQASQMHDIGKIGIPDHILLKPGKLDPDERRVIETHCTIGAEILRDAPSPLLATAGVIAATHHEKWDGSGYPNRLAGEDIAVEGRITAICDVFDALTMSRPYKRGWSVEEAMAYIRNEAGKHFDPHFVDLFGQMLAEIEHR